MSHGLKNKIVYATIFFVFAVIIEMITFLYTDGVVFAKYVGFDIAVLTFFCALIIASVHDKAAMTISLFMLGFQIILSYTNVNLLKITGEVFSWDMLKVLSEAATATGKGITITFSYLFITIPLYALAIWLCVSYDKRFKNKNYHFTINKFSAYSVLIVLLMCFGIGTYQLTVLNVQRSVDGNDKTHSSLNDSFLFNTFYVKQEALQKFGTYGYYFLSSFDFKASKPITEVEETYATYSKAHESNAFTGISAGNNVIMMLFETGDVAAINKDLTPNLYKLVTESIYLSGYHAKDQTNISEAKFLFGSYPVSNTLNGSYTDNVYPFTLPSMYKTLYPNAQVGSFHGNYKEYYKRDIAHLRYGFDFFIGKDEAEVVSSTWVSPDSVFFDHTLSSYSNISEYTMIPADTSKQFMTYIASFSTHGPFYASAFHDRREEYAPYKAVIEAYLAAGNEIKTFYGDTVDVLGDEKYMTYMCAAMDFDIAIGKMMHDLEVKNLLDKTTIMILTDHYAYYNDVAKDIRGITSDYDINLYNAPGFIYDTKLKTAILNNESLWNKYNICYKTYNDSYNTKLLCLDKFTANYDCTPTILNLLGYKYNEADYQGTDMFSYNQESFVFSRYGGIFNKYCYSNDGYTILNMEAFSQAEETGLLPTGYSYDEYYRDLAIVADYRDRVAEFVKKYTFINELYETNYYETHKLIKY